MTFNQAIIQYLTALQDPLVALATIGALFAGKTFYTAFVASKTTKDIYKLGFFSKTTLPFFNQRSDFLKSAFSSIDEEMISFNVFHRTVVAMRGKAARKAFFDNRDLDLIDGYDSLLGGTPRLRDLHDQNLDGMAFLSKQILSLLGKERNAEALPTLFDDIQRRMEGWGGEGLMDPFKDFPDTVFQLSTRVATCRELATDLEATTKFQQGFAKLQKSATGAALLLPWLPTASKKLEQTAVAELRSMLRGYIEERERATTPNSDAIDFLLSQGMDIDRLVNCLLSIIWVGINASSVTVPWLVIFLTSNVEWKQKVIEEIKSTIERCVGNSTEPIHKLLGAIPLSAWEEEMPLLELALHESLRLTVEGTLPRGNIRRDQEILGKRISKGDFVVYRSADVHMDPTVYADPTRFDPTRFMPGKEEDKKEPYAFLGWGAGRHPCTGMKYAKLQVKVIVAFFLVAYQYELVNEKGEPLGYDPMPDYNDIHKTGPTEPFYFAFKRVLD